MATQVGTFAPWAGVEELPTLPDAVTDQMKIDGLQFASDVLFQFTGRQWSGVGESTWFPPPRCGCLPDRCTHDLSRLELLWTPVVSITEILIDGVVVSPSTYRIANEHTLVRLRDPDGARRIWPRYQEDVEPGQPGSWSVKYRHGVAPPVGGHRSALILGEQLARSVAPADDGIECRLPKRVTTITRQGVTLAMLDPLSLFDEGRTGIPEVDLWIGSTRHGSDHRVGAVIDVAGGTGGDGRPRFRRR